MRKVNLTNLLFWVIGLIGFLVAVVMFVAIAAGVDTGGDSVRGGSILFVSFILCAGVAFSGLIIMALTQISSTLGHIEKMMREQVDKGK
jgi:hypothetical protein